MTKLRSCNPPYEAVVPALDLSFRYRIALRFNLSIKADHAFPEGTLLILMTTTRMVVIVIALKYIHVLVV